MWLSHRAGLPSLPGEETLNTGESTGFGKDSHPMVFKTVFKST